MGHAGRGWTTHCEVRYTGVRVPVANTLGQPGDGFRIAQKRLGPGRIHHVMRWLGQMQRAFELMCEYALRREAFGSRLADKQTVQNWIADSAAEIQACRLMTMDAARKIDDGEDARIEISLIKFYAARVLHDVIDRAVQVHGARGLTDETPLAAMLAHGPWRAHLRRPGRGAPDGRRPPDPRVVRGRRALAVLLALGRAGVEARHGGAVDPQLLREPVEMVGVRLRIELVPGRVPADLLRLGRRAVEAVERGRAGRPRPCARPGTGAAPSSRRSSAAGRRPRGASPPRAGAPSGAGSCTRRPAPSRRTRGRPRRSAARRRPRSRPSGRRR